MGWGGVHPNPGWHLGGPGCHLPRSWGGSRGGSWHTTSPLLPQQRKTTIQFQKPVENVLYIFGVALFVKCCDQLITWMSDSSSLLFISQEGHLFHCLNQSGLYQSHVAFFSNFDWNDKRNWRDSCSWSCPMYAIVSERKLSLF